MEPEVKRVTTAALKNFSTLGIEVDTVDDLPSYGSFPGRVDLGSLINAPTMAMPAGFSSTGLPIGLQVISRNHDDFSLMDLAPAWSSTRLMRGPPRADQMTTGRPSP